MKSFLAIFLFMLLSINVYSQQDGLGVWTLDYDNGGRVFALAVNPSNQNIVYSATLENGVYKTTNGGLNWVSCNTGLTYNHVQCIAVSASSPNTVYVGTDSLGGWANSGVYKSTDAGTSWTLVSAGIYDSKGIQWILVHPTDPNIVYVGVFNALAVSAVGVWKTTNGGTTWSPSNTGMDNKQVLCMAFNPLNPNVIYCGTSMMDPATSVGPCKIFKSVNAGASWSAVVSGIPQASTDNNPIRCISVSNSDTSVVLAGLFMNATALSGGMYVTTNGGTSWTQKHSGLPMTTGTLPRACIIIPGTKTQFYVGIDQSAGSGIMGAFRSTDMGNTWTDFNGGSIGNSVTSIRAFAFKTTGNPTLFAGASTATGTKGVHDYAWSPSGVGTNGNVPSTFNLLQNYPNPFNPVTQISYQLPVNGYVKLSVYDMMGREVAVLADGIQKAGYYNVDFNGSSLSSGVYFYRLFTDKFVSTKKMMLVK